MLEELDEVDKVVEVEGVLEEAEVGLDDVLEVELDDVAEVELDDVAEVGLDDVAEVELDDEEDAEGRFFVVEVDEARRGEGKVELVIILEILEFLEMEEEYFFILFFFLFCCFCFLFSTFFEPLTARLTLLLTGWRL